jgi:hypothetical protein
LDRFQALVRGCCASGRLITGKISDDANVENNLMTLASSYSSLLQKNSSTKEHASTVEKEKYSLQFS